MTKFLYLKTIGSTNKMFVIEQIYKLNPLENMMV